MLLSAYLMLNIEVHRASTWERKMKRKWVRPRISWIIANSNMIARLASYRYIWSQTEISIDWCIHTLVKYIYKYLLSESSVRANKQKCPRNNEDT